jgi:hypothetical protein
MSKGGKFSHLSDTHSPRDSDPSLSLSFMVGPAKVQSHRRPNRFPSDGGQSSEEALYTAKYKEMKQKVKEIEGVCQISDVLQCS